MMERVYSNLLNDWPYSERMLFAVSNTLIHNFVYWGFNLLMYLAYVNNWWQKYKIQTNKWPDRGTVMHCLKLLAFNHIVLLPISFYYIFPIFKYFGLHFETPFPSIFEIIWQFAVFIIVNDTAFYWSHRMLHIPVLYKTIHKRHHQFAVSIGIAAEYAHPVEQIFSNSIPTILGPVLVGPHIVTLWLWFFFRIWETVDAHSGYEFPITPFNWIPFFGGPDRHDFHHSNNTGNFGAFFIFWDTVMGTDRNYVLWKQRQINSSKKN